MKTYAMVLRNKVAGILEEEGVPYWPPDPSGNPVTAVECGEEVKIGMTYDGESFSFPEPPEPEPAPEPQPTQLDIIEAYAKTAAADNTELMAFYEAVTAEVEA